jgi:hypothetical protein
VAKGVTTESEMALDIASEEFPVRSGERLSILLTTTLDKHGKPDAGVYMPPGSTEGSMLDDYEYGMYGKVFRVTHQPDGHLYVKNRQARARGAPLCHELLGACAQGGVGFVRRVVDVAPRAACEPGEPQAGHTTVPACQEGRHLLDSTPRCNAGQGSSSGAVAC